MSSLPRLLFSILTPQTIRKYMPKLFFYTEAILSIRTSTSAKKENMYCEHKRKISDEKYFFRMNISRNTKKIGINIIFYSLHEYVWIRRLRDFWVGSFRRTSVSQARSAELPYRPAGLHLLEPCPSYVAWRPEVEFIKLKAAKIYRFLQLLSHSRGFFARV